MGNHFCLQIAEKKDTFRMRNLLALFSAVLALTALSASVPQLVLAQQVYVGSGNGWNAMNAHPNQWAYVRAHADGFYVNFIQMLNPSAKKCALTSSLFAHKSAYYESDSRDTGLGGFPDGGQFSRDFQSRQLFALLNGGFRVSYTSLNYGVSDLKLGDLKHLGLPAPATRPCLAQNGPWLYDGDILKNIGDNVRVRKDTARTDGASTDGPLSLWQTDQGKMRSGSFSIVKYTHSLHKIAAVMVSPYDLKPTSQWLKAAQQCVRQHEDAGARPDIWIVYEYATTTPTLPEAVGGLPADTITGMAYWLIHHLKDPDHVVHMRASADANSGVQTVTVSNSSKWLDLCPTLSAEVVDPRHQWNVRFLSNGKDVTAQMARSVGLPFVRDLRLWPGASRRIQAVMEHRGSSIAYAKGPDIRFHLWPSSPQGQASQVLTVSSDRSRLGSPKKLALKAPSK